MMLSACLLPAHNAAGQSNFARFSTSYYGSDVDHWERFKLMSCSMMRWTPYPRLRSPRTCQKYGFTAHALTVKQTERFEQHGHSATEASKLRIGLICGGPSAERGISLNSARSVLDHLQARALLEQAEDLAVSCYYLDVNLQPFAIPATQMYSNTPSDFDFKLSSNCVYIEEFRKAKGDEVFNSHSDHYYVHHD